MIEHLTKSKCCKASVKVEGIGDFRDNDKPVTMHYVCVACGKPCDVIIKKRPLLERILNLINKKYNDFNKR